MNLDNIALPIIQKRDPGLYQKIEKVLQDAAEEFPVVQKDFKLIKHIYDFLHKDKPFDEDDRDRLILFITYVYYNYYPEKVLGYRDTKARAGFVTALVDTLKVSEFIVRSSITSGCYFFQENFYGFRETILYIHKNHSDKMFELIEEL